MKIKLIIVLSFILFGSLVFGQSVQYQPNALAVEYLRILDIQDSSFYNFHAGLRNYFRKDVVKLVGHLDDQMPSDLRKKYLIQDNSKYFNKEILGEDRVGFLSKNIYKNPANLFQLETENFDLFINPILNLSFGKEKQRETLRFHNMRGLELYGSIDDKVYFYSNILEAQANFHNYVDQRIIKFSAIPGFSFYKPFISRFNKNLVGRDFSNAQGYLGIPISKHINVEFGHGRHFIGHGYNSLLLQDYSNNYFYLKLNTRVWKFHYQNIFAELSPISTRLNPEDVLLPKKYMAVHYLSFKPTQNFEIGLFEAITFSRLNNFEFHYLNPVILYRTVEYYLDSPDNVMLGLNVNWNPWNKFSLYGQIIIDDLRTTELFSGNGWYGNKFGGQLGVLYPEVGGIKNLNARVEVNAVRPFTYTHRDTVPSFPNYSIANYSNYNQPLAHPLGANFQEIIFTLDYQPTESILLKMKYIRAVQGQSRLNFYSGDNILRPDSQRESDFGASFLQGKRTTMNLFQLDLSYSFLHNYFIDLKYLVRREDSGQILNTDYWGIGIRANIVEHRIDY